MGLTIGNSRVDVNNFQNGNLFTPDEKTVSVESENNLTGNQQKLPPIENSVTFTALGCDTELRLARAGYMAAAAKAGISSTAAQMQFADQMIQANPPQLHIVRNGKPNIELDDESVKNRLFNQSVSFSLDKNDRTALEQFRKQYQENGGKIHFNNKPTVDLRGEPGAVTGNIPADSATATGNIKCRVFLNNKGNPTDPTRILAQYSADTYGGGNLWDDNHLQIGEMSIGQGVKPQNIKIQRAGSQSVVEFTLTPLDRAKINENYKLVQAQVNEIDKIVEQINRDNPVSQFIVGAVNGIKDNLVGSAEMAAHPLETLKTIKEAVTALSQLSADDVAKITNLLKEKGVNLLTTKDGVNSLPYGAGYAVGTVATDIVIGKGAGIALEGLKEIKPIANLLSKVEDLKLLAKTKVVEAFSDEAASAAANRLRGRLAATTLYAGVPADALADLAVVATNKVKNGAVKFSDFSKQMVDELGDKVRPKLLELYQESFEKVFGKRKDLGLDELLGGHPIEKHVGKSENWLRQRLLDEPFTEYASSFRNYEMANKVVGKAVKENTAKIEKWLARNSSNPLRLEATMESPIGIVLGRGKGGSIGLKTAKETSTAEIILIRDNTPKGWHVLTSYPTN